MINLTPKERLLKHTIKTKNCWLWKGPFFTNGYGAFGLNYKTKRAHRVSWEIFKGKIPFGLIVCHKCDNPACINPNHLFLGTSKDNQQDCIKKDRRNNPAGEKNWISKLTNIQAQEIRNKYIRKNYHISNAKELCLEYNISVGGLHKILRNETYC